MLTDSQTQTPLNTQMLILGSRNFVAKPLAYVESLQIIRYMPSRFGAFWKLRVAGRDILHAWFRSPLKKKR